MDDEQRTKADTERAFVRQFQKKQKIIDYHEKPEIAEWAALDARWDAHIQLLVVLISLRCGGAARRRLREVRTARSAAWDFGLVCLHD
jgi:hypothetical protein